jgi:lysophospholipase L1-like esterase
VTARWSWHQAARTAGTARVPVVVVGSSTVAGMNATTASRRVVDVLAATLRARHNAPGVIGGTGVTAYGGGYGSHGWTRSGGAAVTNRGLGFTGWQLGAAAYIERTFTGTAVTVLFEQGPGAGVFTVAIDGGAPVTVTPDTTGATRNDGTWTSSTVTAGSHTVRITGVGTCVIESVYLHNGDQAAGVQMHNSGLGGATTADLAATPGLTTRLAQLQPALVLMLLTSNDYQAGTNPATSKTRVQSWLTGLFAAVSPAPSVLLVHPHRRLDVTAPAFPWEQYGQALADIAAADPERVAYADLSGLYPASQAADTLNLIDSDDIHLTDGGHQVMADALASNLAFGVTYDAALSRVRISAVGLGLAPTATVERSTDQARWTTVRGGTAVPVTAGTADLDDYEFVPDVPNYYRVTAGTTLGDSFARAVANGWGGGWTTAGGVPGDYAATGSAGTHSVGTVGSSRRTLIGTPGAYPDQTVTVSTSALATGASQQASVMARYQDLDNLMMIRARLNTNQTVDAMLVARVGGVETDLAVTTVSGLTHAAGSKIKIRALDYGTELRVKVWSAAGSQPAVWHATVASSAITAAGLGGVRSILASGNTNTLPVVFTYDDYSTIPIQYSGSITPTLDGVWLKSIARPFLNRQVTVLDFSDVERPSRTGVFEVIGRSYPVAVNDLAGSRRWTLDVLTQTLAEAADFDLVLASGDPLFVHVPADCPVPGGYVTVGSTTERRTARRSVRRVFSMPCTEIAAPGPDVVGATQNWQTVLSAYATWSAVLAAQPTWADLLELIGSPTDVVVP